MPRLALYALLPCLALMVVVPVVGQQPENSEPESAFADLRIRKEYDEAGKLLRLYTVVDVDGAELPHGIYMRFQADGQLVMQRTYFLGKLEGRSLSYDEASNRSRSEGYHRDGKLSGLYRQWGSDGQQQLEANYVNGKLHGTELRWESGLRCETTYRHGTRHGPYEATYADGTPFSSGQYAEDVKDGVWSEYWNNGQLSSHGAYEEGEKQGFWRHWRRNGTVLTEGKYRRGVRVGIWKAWNDEGELTSENDHGEQD